MPFIKQKKQLKDVKTQTNDTVVDDDQLGVETKELFVLKTKWIEETTTKVIEIHDFILKLEEEDKNLKIVSPNFKLAGKVFFIGVCSNNDSGFIGVYICNYGNKDQMASITVQETSGVERCEEKAKMKAGQAIGFPMFLSLENYRELAKVNGDVLRLEVVVTLHIKVEAEGNVWTR